jgi:hypothetical protein
MSKICKFLIDNSKPDNKNPSRTSLEVRLLNLMLLRELMQADFEERSMLDQQMTTPLKKSQQHNKAHFVTEAGKEEMSGQKQLT